MTLMEEYEDVFVHEENEPENGPGGRFPYAQDMSQNRGVFHQDLDPDEFVNRELNKALGCGRTALGLDGIKTMSRYYKFIYCMRWFCRQCGSNGGRIHKKRMAGILEKISSTLDVDYQKVFQYFDLRQIVLTVPVPWRVHFLTRKAINGLYRMAEKIIKAMFPGKPCIAYFHPFGDKDPGFYHPHMNIHVLEEKGQRLEIDQDTLQVIKTKWYKALVHFGCKKEALGVSDPKEGIRRMNVHYSFQTVAGKKAHRLKYMCRPNPGYLHAKAIKADPLLKDLFYGTSHAKGMAGFQYVRYFNGFKRGVVKDIDRKAEIKECETLAGEPLRVARDRDGHITYKTRTEIELLYQEKDLEELGDGFYRTITRTKEKKRKWQGENNTIRY